MRRRPRRLKAEMNVVPYIDVMLVLLVIFMIATPLINQGVAVALPTAPGKPFAMPKEIPDNVFPLVIALSPNGETSINGLKQNAAEMVATIRAARSQWPRLPVIIRADQKAVLAQAIALMMTLKRAGIDGVGLATQTP